MSLFSSSKILLGAIGLAGLLGSTFAQASAYDLGLSLAIDYFGAEAPTPREIIGYGPNPSPEYRYMGSLAFELAKKSPDLVRILSPNINALENYEDPHLTLTGSFSDDASVKQIEALVIGCPYAEEISQTVSEVSGSPKVTQRILKYDLKVDSKNQNDLVCMNTSVQKLKDLGIWQVRVKYDLAYNAVELSMVSWGSARNMAYVAAQMGHIRGLKTLASNLKSARGTGGVLGSSGGKNQFKFTDANSSHVIGNPVNFTYNYGWGDCMAGCIYNHSWTVIAKPLLQTDGSYKFDVDVTETGSVLP